MPFTFKLSRRLARSRALVLVLASAALNACGSGENSPTSLQNRRSDSTAGVVASIAISPSTASGSLGQSAQFSATAYTATGAVVSGQSFTWTSTDSTVAGVSASGYATAVGVGSATLVATAGGVRGTAPVTVSGDALSTIAVTPSSLSGTVGQRWRLAATLTGASGAALTGRRVIWSSGNAAVASVDTTGLVTAAGAGMATITAYSEGKSATATVSGTAVTAPGTVTDLAAAGATDSAVTLSFTQITDGAGAPASYDVRFAPGTLSWGSAATVTSGTCAAPVAGTAIGSKLTCTVTGLAPSTAYQFQLVAFRGTLNVNAVFGSLSNVASGTTAALPPSSTVASVTVSPSSASGSVGQAAQFSATAYSASGTALTGQSFTWASSNTAVATVTSSGYVTAVGGGSATITATDAGKSGTASVTVSGGSTPGAPASVTVSPSTASVVLGGTQQFSATVKDANGNVLSGQTLTWSSSNLSIATVSVGGLVTSLLAGTATITATDGSIKGTATLTVSSQTPPPGSTGWSNQPSGFTTLTDQPWDGLTTLNWQIFYNTNNYATISSDGSAPASPGNVLQYEYPTGFAAGSAPATEVYFLPNVTRIYAGMWWKPSNPWQGNSSNVNKIAFYYTNSLGDIYIAMYGTPGGPYYLRVLTEFNNITPTWLTPNVNNVAVTLGQWHKVEWLIQYDTSNPSAGTVQFWMDGQLIGSYSNVQFPAAPLTEFHLSPTWGGMDGTKTETDYYWFDQVYLSHN